MRYFGIFRLKFEQKNLFKFRSKQALFAYLVIFGMRFSKTVIIFEISPRTLQNAKFRAIIKILKLGTKNASDEYFWTSILKTIVILK